MMATVLIVDDSLTVRMDLADTFEVAGYRTAPCATLAEARRVLGSQHIDLAILDVMLPDGNGVELLEEMRRNTGTRNIPILMLSSETEVRDRIRGLQTGANDYVGKPYNADYVIARAQELLRHVSGEMPETGQTVLVIDDSLTFREALSAALRGQGYRVRAAPNGEEGLRLAAAFRPAALIVDGEMPGMRGETVLRKVRLDAALRTMPCLFLTAAQERSAELLALDAGADAFVRKDAAMGVILARFAAMLRNSQSHAATLSSLESPKRILVVDDEDAALQGIAAGLRDASYDVVAAHSGEAAIELLSVQNVDCILLDLSMPGLGGAETCRRIKASPTMRNIPLLFMANEDDAHGQITAMGYGADDYLMKQGPADLRVARIQAQLRRKQFEDERREVRDQHLRAELEATEARAARELAETRAVLVEELRYKNEELEAFSYSVSHDLRAPLRAIDGFSEALFEDCAQRLDDNGRHYLERIRGSVRRMSSLIDDMLQLSRVGRSQLERRPVDLSVIAHAVIEELRRGARDDAPAVEALIDDGLIADADGGMMRIVLDNLLGNAWKFSGRKADPRIEFKAQANESGPVFYVRDNGAGFDMAHAAHLFQPFKRLHLDSEFQGTGIGLATVQRIIARHGGRIWAEAAVGKGATVFFTLPPPR